MAVIPKAFGLTGPRDLLEKLRADVDRLRASREDAREEAFIALDCALDAWALVDWIDYPNSLASAPRLPDGHRKEYGKPVDSIADTALEICSEATMAGHHELFHYTKRPAFQGIVASNSFWASHYADMADKTEVLVLKDQLPEAIAPEYEAIVAPLPRHKRRLFKASGGGIGVARDFVNSLYGATFQNKSGFTALDAFMVSFSTHAGDGDAEREHGLQSQWKKYAGPDGFCLVFDTKQMAEHLGNEMDSRYWVRLTLDPVRYSGAPVGQIFPELVDKSAETLRQFLAGTTFPEMAVPEFLAGATLLKNSDYREERELRIVAIPGTKRLSDQAVNDHPQAFKVLPLPPIHTRPASDGRYVSVFEDLTVKLPIKRVIVGPSDRQSENAEFARSIVGDVPVTLSLCPKWD